MPVKILRYTGSSESFILESVFPFSEVSSEGRSVLIRGIGLNTLSVPLHRVHLTSDLICGEVSLGVRPTLPVDGVTVILGNNLAGGRVWREVIPPPEVVPRAARYIACDMHAHHVSKAGSLTSYAYIAFNITCDSSAILSANCVACL